MCLLLVSGSGMKHVNPSWVIYNELIKTSKPYMRQVMVIEPEWIRELAPRFFELSVLESDENEGPVSYYLT